MNKIPKLSLGAIESISHLLGEGATGTEITNFLKDKGIEDNSGESTKWKRLYSTFVDLQKKDGLANRVLDISKTILDPARFIDKADKFEEYRQKFNQILAFSGLEYGKNGEFKRCEQAQNLDEAERRVQTIQSKFKGRSIHSEVLKYCKAELMRDNLFHAVFEATKGLAERIRDKSEIRDEDGSLLVDKVFSIKQPVLAFNSLRTETEKSEHKGFASLLKGCFSAVRNPLAHRPKILWKGEDDIIDYFSLISFLHRKLDNCIVIQYNHRKSKKEII